MKMKKESQEFSDGFKVGKQEAQKEFQGKIEELKKFIIENADCFGENDLLRQIDKIFGDLK